MVDKSDNELQIARPPETKGVEAASKQFSKKLHERWSARAAYWLATAEIEGRLSKTLLELAQKENPDLPSLLDSARELESKQAESEGTLRRIGLVPSRAYPTQSNCGCSGIVPQRRLVPGGTPGAVPGGGWTTGVGWTTGAGAVPGMGVPGSSYPNLSTHCIIGNIETELVSEICTGQ